VKKYPLKYTKQVFYAGNETLYWRGFCLLIFCY